MYRHYDCLSQYIDSTSCTNNTLFRTCVNPIINDLINNTYVVSLSELKDMLSEANPGKVFYNPKIKQYIEKEFEGQVSFCSSNRKNESLTIYPSCITTSDVMSKLKQLDFIRSAVLALRNDLLHNTDFELSDRFLDRSELGNAWFKTKMPESVATFLSALFNTRKTDLLRKDEEVNHEVDYDGTDDENIKGCSYRKKCMLKKFIKACFMR